MEVPRQNVFSYSYLSILFAAAKNAGIRGLIDQDILCKVKEKYGGKPLSRRGLFATLSLVFDPLRLVAPSSMKGMEIIQELCCGSFQWDVQISDEIKFQWMKWKNKFSLLNDIEVTRCCKSREFGKVIEYSLHHFSDASERGLWAGKLFKAGE